MTWGAPATHGIEGHHCLLQGVEVTEGARGGVSSKTSKSLGIEVENEPLMERLPVSRAFG